MMYLIELFDNCYICYIAMYCNVLLPNVEKLETVSHPPQLDSITVPVFVDILVEFDRNKSKEQFDDQTSMSALRL